MRCECLARSNCSSVQCLDDPVLFSRVLSILVRGVDEDELANDVDDERSDEFEQFQWQVVLKCASSGHNATIDIYVETIPEV